MTPCTERDLDGVVANNPSGQDPWPPPVRFRGHRRSDFTTASGQIRSQRSFTQQTGGPRQAASRARVGEWAAAW